MAWILRIFRRPPAPSAFWRAMGYHVLATTHDGVGRWYHRGKS